MINIVNVGCESVICVKNMQTGITASRKADAVVDRHNVIIPAVHDYDWHVRRRGRQGFVARHIICRRQDEQTNGSDLCGGRSGNVTTHT